MISDKVWEREEISRWVCNDEGLYALASNSPSPYRFLGSLKDCGIVEIGGIELTLENIKESWNDVNG